MSNRVVFELGLSCLALITYTADGTADGMASVSLEVRDLRVLEPGDTSEGKDPFLKWGGAGTGQFCS